MSTSPDAAPATDPPEPGNTPVRRRRTGGARHGRKSAPTPLRAARSGALWAAIVAWSAAIWLKDYSHGFNSDYLFGEWQAHSTAILLLFQVFACIVRFFEYFSVDLVERSRRLDVLRLSAAPTTMGIGIILAFIPWWQSYAYTGRAAVLPTLIMIALILQSTRWILSVIPRIRQGMREAADEDAAALPAEPELGMRRGRRRWAWPLAAVSFIAPAVPLAISAAALPLLSPDLRVHAEQSVAAPIPDDALPAVPTAVPTQVSWTVEVSTADGGASLAPGARGPSSPPIRPSRGSTARRAMPYGPIASPTGATAMPLSARIDHSSSAARIGSTWPSSWRQPIPISRTRPVPAPSSWTPSPAGQRRNSR